MEKDISVLLFLISHKLTPVDWTVSNSSNNSGLLNAELQGSTPPLQKATLNHCGEPIEFNASRKGETTAFSVNLFKGWQLSLETSTSFEDVPFLVGLRVSLLSESTAICPKPMKVEDTSLRRKSGAPECLKLHFSLDYGLNPYTSWPHQEIAPCSIDTISGQWRAIAKYYRYARDVCIKQE